jgi:cephalosporin hydroxylase
MDNEIEKFKAQVNRNIEQLGKDEELYSLSIQWSHAVSKHNWVYNFTCMGVPVIQAPNDLWALQEIAWKVKPDLIIETGVARGGSLIWSACLLALLDMAERPRISKDEVIENTRRKVIGIDVDIRAHNRDVISQHPMSSYIELIEGSSVSLDLVDYVKKSLEGYTSVLVLLDSNHTHDHVLAELNLYSNFVSRESYIIVSDTVIEDMPDGHVTDRPWGRGNSPKSAVHEFLSSNDQFVIDEGIHNKLQITSSPHGFLRRVSG